MNAYVSTAVALSLRERERWILRQPKETLLLHACSKQELSEANTLIDHCFVLCHFFAVSV